MDILCYAIMVIVPYLLSGINWAIIVTKIKSGEDIRKIGSGNGGLTNVLRTQGKLVALFVLLGDVAKGVASVLLVKLAFWLILGIDAGNINSGYNWVCYAAGFFAVIGHTFPLYFKFKGGKGILVTVAVLLAIDWIPAVLLLLLFGIIVAITKYVSLGSVIAASAYPFTVLVYGLITNNASVYLNFVLALLIAAMLVFMHRENIKRLVSKTEKKLGEKKE